MTQHFVHLNVHSEYSVYDGLLRIPKLLATVKAYGMPAVALTDRSNLFGAVKFYRAAVAMGIKPILGADMLVVDDIWGTTDQAKRMILLCKNTEGYHQLSKIITRCYQNNQHAGEPHLPLSWLQANHTQGLLALSGGQMGILSAELLADTKKLDDMLCLLSQLFPDRFYIELQRIGRSQEIAYLNQMLCIATQKSLPVVATNAACFMSASDYDAHEARVCIEQGRVLDDQTRKSDYTDQQFLCSAEHISTCFPHFPQVLSNTLEIMKRCTVELAFDQVHLPAFSPPNNESITTYFTKHSGQCLQNLFEERKQLEEEMDDHTKQAYCKRLDNEISIIENMGFSGYFLIVADFIQWAKDNQVPVGPGRGSGAGSLVAYVLGITDIDPIRYDLLFERFLNPERVSMPDFDIDFCMLGRDRVIEYVTAKYGKERVSQIITYGTMAAKAVVRDVGRVLGYPYGMVDKLAKLIPFELGITIDKALEQEEILLKHYREEEDVKRLIDLAKKLEGCIRNVGKHAGGVVIAPQDLVAYTPLYCEPESDAWVSQFDKDDIEAIGLIKFDFLGLRTLTVIDLAIKMVNQDREDKIDIRHIAMNDSKTFALLKSCETTAVFQLESRGMKELIKRLQPDCFDEIVALVALFRPGPLQSGMVDEFIDRKHGRSVVKYMHPVLKPILQPTYGVILYQEQVMQIAQVLSGLSLGGADLLRRAMGKKKAEEMAKQRAGFISGAKNNQVDEVLAGDIFDLIEKFAGYGFNKSHSVAYALLAYQTAWLKAQFPAEFMAAVMTADMDNTDKIVVLIVESRVMGLRVVPPCVNRSDSAFTVDQQAIIYGLGAIKGIGQSIAQSIVQERAAQGAYKHLADFCARLATVKLSRRVIEILSRSGALDCFAVHRASIVDSIDKALALTQQDQRNQLSGQTDIFQVQSTQLGGIAHDAFEYVASPVWSDEVRLSGEKAVLGFYLSGHPMDAYLSELNQLGIVSVSKVTLVAGQVVFVAGIVAAVRKILTKHGKRIAYVTLEDQHATLDIAMFHEAFQQYQALLEPGQLLIAKGEAVYDDFRKTMKLTCSTVKILDQLRRSRAPQVLLSLSEDTVITACLTQLQAVCMAHKGGKSQVIIRYQHDVARVKLACGQAWQVKVSEAFLQDIRGVDAICEVDLVY